MHLGIKNLVGGAKKYLFGDGRYSQNIITTLANNLSGVGAVAIASDYYNSSYAPYLMFNGGEKTTASGGWQDNNNGAVVGKYAGRYFGGLSKNIRTLRIWNGQYVSGWRANIKDIVVEGSNDCVMGSSDLLTTVGTWTKIPVVAITGGTIINTDEARLDAEAGSGVSPTSVLTLGGTAQYKAVRIRFTSMPWTMTWPHIREMEMDECLQPQSSYVVDILKTSGVTVTQDSYNTSYPGLGQYVFDGNITGGGGNMTHCWQAAGTSVPHWLEFQYSQVTVLNKYEMVGFPVGYDGGVAPRDWVFQGWDGSAWVTLDTRSGYTTWASGEWKSFTFSNTTAFTRYRIYVTLNATGGLLYTTIAEMRLYEAVTLQNAIVITGAATVAPDATTGAAVFTAQNVVINGGTLSPTTNCKGLIGIVSESLRLTNGGRAHIDKLGRAGNFGNLTVLDLVPDTLKRKLKPSLAAYVVLGEGAAGGGVTTCDSSAASPTYANRMGIAASSMQTGGGGSGQAQANPPGSAVPVNRGGKGGPCCGGAGGAGDYYSLAASTAAGPYGGPGGTGMANGSGGPGDPPGTGGSANLTAPSAGGGLLMFFTPAFSVESGCIVSADGSPGTANTSANYPLNSGGAGGGCVAIGTLSGGYRNNGTVRAAGGLGYANTYAETYKAGSGGVGSVNTFSIAA